MKHSGNGRIFLRALRLILASSAWTFSPAWLWTREFDSEIKLNQLQMSHSSKSVDLFLLGWGLVHGWLSQVCCLWISLMFCFVFSQFLCSFFKLQGFISISKSVTFLSQIHNFYIGWSWKFYSQEVHLC